MVAPARYETARASNRFRLRACFSLVSVCITFVISLLVSITIISNVSAVVKGLGVLVYSLTLAGICGGVDK